MKKSDMKVLKEIIKSYGKLWGNNHLTMQVRLYPTGEIEINNTIIKNDEI